MCVWSCFIISKSKIMPWYEHYEHCLSVPLGLSCQIYSPAHMRLHISVGALWPSTLQGVMTWHKGIPTSGFPQWHSRSMYESQTIRARSIAIRVALPTVHRCVFVCVWWPHVIWLPFYVHTGLGWVGWFHLFLSSSSLCKCSPVPLEELFHFIVPLFPALLSLTDIHLLAIFVINQALFLCRMFF